MPMIATSEKMVLNQFPQPARPPNSYVTGFQEQSVDQSYVVPEPPSVVKEYELGEGKLAIVDKLFNRVLDKCDKHVKSQSTTSRGLHQHPVQEKLERFKVRTVLAGEVIVKEEDKK